MKKNLVLFVTLCILLSGCAPHFHLDFLGKDKIQEVVLIKSKAKEKILILDVSGIIGTSLSFSMFEREKDLLSMVYHRLEKASEDEAVSAVILRLDTPGGEVTASDILYNEILRFKEKTGVPVVGLMMGLAASGGYYIASASDYIIAHPSTITGSIGVISIFPNLQELFTKIGIKVKVIKSGEMKDSGSSFRDMSEEEKEVFQGIIDELYKNFLEVVYEKRKKALSFEKLKDIADGRVYTARQAYDLKLIDKIGYFDSALEKALSLSRLKEAKVIAYTYYPKRKTNIYATSLKKSSFLEGKSLEDVLPSLKSGFYYLWLPQLSNFYQ
ncbi:MAG: signal peptide peptidase SppA [Candidatus Aminicenantes bacterium]|nr:MAG: signal peptide peptidase SppA [Candidatus Aminicenantes bacterium]